MTGRRPRRWRSVLRRGAGLALLLALAGGQATAVVGAVSSGTAGEHHHHPGCPWEARGEPCPHAHRPASPESPEWAACPPVELQAPIAGGPDLAPPAPAFELRAAPPVEVRRPGSPPAVVEVPFVPEPRPPRVTLPLAH